MISDYFFKKEWYVVSINDEMKVCIKDWMDQMSKFSHYYDVEQFTIKGEFRTHLVTSQGRRVSCIQPHDLSYHYFNGKFIGRKKLWGWL